MSATQDPRGRLDSSRSAASSKVAERALDVLICLLEQDGELGVTEISRRVDIDKGSVHRFLSALRNKGFVELNPHTRRYSLGIRVLQLGQSLTRQILLQQQALPFLEEIQERSGESAGLAMRIGCYRVHVASAISRHELRHTYPLFQLIPIHIGAAGKVLLAFMGEEERQAVFKELLSIHSASTHEQITLVQQELEAIRRRGYAMSLSERNKGSRSIAAPVWGYHDELLTITNTGPESRFTFDQAESAVPHLLEIAERLTTHLAGS